MRTKGPFHELANIVVAYSKTHKQPLNTAFFLAAMKAQTRVSSGKKTVHATHKTRRWDRGSGFKDSTDPYSLEIAHTVYSQKPHMPPDPDGEDFRITVKGSWVESGEAASNGAGNGAGNSHQSGKKVVNYSFSYSAHEFVEPVISSIPVDLVQQVLSLASKAMGVEVVSEPPVRGPRLAKAMPEYMVANQG
ncbi:MAG TPA: hypothetical protein DCY07_00120 [Rhodospirillaceae bacterium]|nr:hypothetical protein [Rhodospirillaceae bacterium]